MHKTHKNAGGGAPRKRVHGRVGVQAEPLLVVPIARVTVTGPPFGVAFEEENVQFAPAGKPVQVSWTCWLNPFNGVTMIE